MNIDEIKDKLFADADKYVLKQKQTGGQSCGMPPIYFRVHNEDIGIDITISNFRSVHKNKDLAEILFKLAIDEIVK